MQAQLGTDPIQRFGQEVPGSHPVLDRAERMLDGLSSDAHGLGPHIKPSLHPFQGSLMLPAADPALLAGSAFLLNRATRAIRTPIAVDQMAILNARKAPGQSATTGATVLVGLGIVDEVLFVEPTLCPGAGRHRLGYVGSNPSVVAGQDLIPVVVAAVS